MQETYTRQVRLLLHILDCLEYETSAGEPCGFTGACANATSGTLETSQYRRIEAAAKETQGSTA